MRLRKAHERRCQHKSGERGSAHRHIAAAPQSSAPRLACQSSQPPREPVPCRKQCRVYVSAAPGVIVQCSGAMRMCCPACFLLNNRSRAVPGRLSHILQGTQICALRGLCCQGRCARSSRPRRGAVGSGRGCGRHAAVGRSSAVLVLDPGPQFFSTCRHGGCCTCAAQAVILAARAAAARGGRGCGAFTAGGGCGDALRGGSVPAT